MKTTLSKDTYWEIAIWQYCQNNIQAYDSNILPSSAETIRVSTERKQK
jgi:hypothetical protein